ncbi:MAG: TolC family protein [Proteobacteria bacterium]|nr:TolC family protein [Pseudomonadota bacterium]
MKIKNFSKIIYPLSLRDTETRHESRPALRGTPSRMSKGHRGIILIIATLVSSCTMEPKYKKPEAPVPFASAQESGKKKLAMISWREYFQSPDLQRLIQLALDNNKDLKIAALNIEVAEGTNGVARSNLLPTITGSAYETRQGVPSGFASFTPKRQYRANVGFTSYEVDFFGRLRSLKKAALEDFLATKEARNITKISVIAETANAYAQLLLDQEILEIAEQNMKVQSDRYTLTERRYKNGIDSQATLLAAQSLKENAKVSFESYKKIVTQDVNALMALTGVFDESSLPQDSTINDIKIDEELLDFVPSENLLLRPDIKQAEHNLKEANANIGAARAAFFPSITLTGTFGYGSRNLNTLTNSRSWTFTPQINLPIFSGGRNIANLDIANARKNIQIVQYEKAIQTAFREASDQLAERESVTNQLRSYNKILAVSKKSYDLSESKHEAGIMSALDVLNTQITFLTARQNQAASKKEYITNLIMLYKVMGGGSELEELETSKAQ